MAAAKWPVTIDEVYEIVQEHGLRKNREELSLILQQLDVDRISEAAANFGDYRDQCDAVDAEIENQLVGLGLISLVKFVRPNESPQYLLRFFNRLPKEVDDSFAPSASVFGLHMNRGFGYKLKDTITASLSEGNDNESLLKIFEAAFPENENASQESVTEINGKKYRLVIFDNDFFELNMNAKGLRAIEATLRKVVDRGDRLEGAIFRFYTRISETLTYQEKGLPEKDYGRQDYRTYPAAYANNPVR